MLTVAAILGFFAAFLVTIAALGFNSSRFRVRRSLDRLATYDATEVVRPEDLSFVERVMLPVIIKLGLVVKSKTSAKRLDEVRQKLALAGARHLSPEQFIGLRLGLAVGVLVTYVVVITPWLIIRGHSPWIGVVFVIAAYLAPGLWLRRRIEGRQKSISADLPDAIDILTIAIEAGLAFDSALARVAKNTGGALGEEFGRTLWELQIGSTRAEAIRNLGQRTTVPELQGFCTTVVQSESFGISISKILRAQAIEIRTKRRQAAEEAALKTPVKLVFPVVLIILPALMIVIFGPGIIRISETLIGLGD